MDTIGEPAGSITEADGSLTVYFDTTMAGYPGWKWTVSLAHLKGFGPSVLETELTPSEGALLSPDWVPWSERLADYKEAQALLAAEGLADTDDDSGDDDDDDDDDFSDEDVNDDDEALLHSGDLDGVDIDDVDIDDVDINDMDINDIAVDSINDTDVSIGGSVAAAMPTVSDDKGKKAKGQAGGASPEPTGKPRRNQRSKKDQQNDKGE